MSGLLVPLLKIQKVHFSLMTNSSGEVSFDLESSRSFSGRQSGEKWQHRKNEALRLKIPVVPTLLGKFQLSLTGGDGACRVPAVSPFPWRHVPVELQELGCITAWSKQCQRVATREGPRKWHFMLTAVWKNWPLSPRPQSMLFIYLLCILNFLFYCSMI